jgi:hypothetical protein
LEPLGDLRTQECLGAPGKHGLTLKGTVIDMWINAETLTETQRIRYFVGRGLKKGGDYYYYYYYYY